MGQGTDSCGGWELEYDPVSEGLDDGTWVNGQSVSSMNAGHLRNAIRYARRKAKEATFSCTHDDWLEWVDRLESELEQKQSVRRASKPTSKLPAGVVTVKHSQTQPTRGKKVSRACDNCGTVYKARVADVKRGWGLTCSKSCAGSVREGMNKTFRRLRGK